MIWFTSDLHFGHDREFIYNPRGFENVGDMNAAIVERYNSIVQDNDEVYILGDLVVGQNKPDSFELINQLKGKKIIIRGNHDSNARIKIYQDKLSIPVFDAKYLKIDGYNLFLSHYPTLAGNCDGDKPLKARTICLCGHYHTENRFTSMEGDNLIYHVELDAHNCYPVSFDTIISDIEIYERSRINK